MAETDEYGMILFNQTQKDIVHEIGVAVRDLGGDHALQAIINSWGDSIDDAETLASLRAHNGVSVPCKVEGDTPPVPSNHVPGLEDRLQPSPGWIVCADCTTYIRGEESFGGLCFWCTPAGKQKISEADARRVLRQVVETTNNVTTDYICPDCKTPIPAYKVYACNQRNYGVCKSCAVAAALEVSAPVERVTDTYTCTRHLNPVEDIPVSEKCSVCGWGQPKG